MRIDTTVYKSRNNVIGIAISADNTDFTASQYGAITRAQFLIGSTLLDSAVTPAAFDLTQTDRVTVKPGAANLTAVAEGTYIGWLVIFDADNPLGIVVGQLNVMVRAV